MSLVEHSQVLLSVTSGDLQGHERSGLVWGGGNRKKEGFLALHVDDAQLACGDLRLVSERTGFEWICQFETVKSYFYYFLFILQKSKLLVSVVSSDCLVSLLLCFLWV